MQISYQLTEKDFVEAFRTHRNRTPFRKWWRRIVPAIVVITGLALFVFAMQSGDRSASSFLQVFGLVMTYLVLLWSLRRWNIRRQFRKQPAAHGPRTVTLDADGTHIRWDGGSNDVAWKNYIRWAEGPNQILLYTSPACFGILSTRTLQPSQVAELREILKRNIQAMKESLSEMIASESLR